MTLFRGCRPVIPSVKGADDATHPDGLGAQRAMGVGPGPAWRSLKDPGGLQMGFVG